MSAFSEKLIIIFYFIKYRYFMKFSSRKQLFQWQNKVLKKFIKKIRSKSKFYNKIWDNKSFKDFPVISKNIMMKNFNELNTVGLNREECLNLAIASENSRDFSSNINNITIGLSSGTSGHRGLFVASPFERAKYAGTILAKALPQGRVFKKNKVALFLRANSNLYKAVKSKFISFKFYDILNDINLYKKDLNKYQPDLLIAQPSVLKALAEMKNQEDLDINPYRIFSAAEVLEDVDKAFIENAFNTSLHQIYQCTEGFLGISCEHGSLHLNEDVMFIEKEPLENHPYKFRPIISDFNRITQPIIKYKLNDILTEAQSSCPCGSSLLTISNIDGRSDDSIYFKSALGKGWQIIWSDLIRNHILYAGSDIEDYRITQKDNSHLEISVKTTTESNCVNNNIKKELLNLANKMKCLLPPLSFRNFIPHQSFTNKLRRISSEFKPDQQETHFQVEHEV